MRFRLRVRIGIMPDCGSVAMTLENHRFVEQRTRQNIYVLRETTLDVKARSTRNNYAIKE
jgi:hypothetical protein